MRQKAIEAILNEIDTLDTQEIEKLINGFSQPDAEEKYEQFCMSLIYVLKQFIEKI